MIDLGRVHGNRQSMIALKILMISFMTALIYVSFEVCDMILSKSWDLYTSYLGITLGSTRISRRYTTDTFKYKQL
jgi:hypothetical protein